MFGHMSYSYDVAVAAVVTDLAPNAPAVVIGDQTAWGCALAVKLPDLVATADVVAQVQGQDETGAWYDLGSDLRATWPGGAASPDAYYIRLTSTLPASFRLRFYSANPFAAHATVRLYSTNSIRVTAP